MWHFWRRRRDRDERLDSQEEQLDPQEDVSEAALALLSGRVADGYLGARQTIPQWTILNALAHRPVEELDELAYLLAVSGSRDWAGAAATIASALRSVGPDEAAEIRSILVRAELDVLASGRSTSGAAVVRAVRQMMAARRRHGTRPPGATVRKAG